MPSPGPSSSIRGQIYVREEKLDPNLQFILTRKPYDPSHNLLLHRNVSFVANVRVNAINTDKPPGYANYVLNASVGGTNTYTSNNADKLGKRWADWFEYFGYVRGYGETLDGLYAGAIRASNFGVLATSGKSLMFDPGDGINSKSNSPFHAYSTRLGAGTQSDGSLTLGDYMTIAIASFKAELDARNLCYPRYFTQDTAELIDTGAGINGYIQSALASSRSTTEVIYRDWDGSEWVNKTLYDAYTEAGSPTYNMTQFWYHSTNRNFVIRMQPYAHRINDHAISIVAYNIAKTQFPKILCGNYSVCHPIFADSQQTQYWEHQNNWFRYPYATLDKKRYLEGDFQCPDIYSPNMNSNNITSYHPIFNTGFPSPPSDGHIFGASLQDVYRSYCTQMVSACLLNDNNLPVVAYTEGPHEQILGGSYPVYDATEDDMAYIWSQNNVSGATRWVVNNESQTSSNASMAITRSDQLLSAINSTIGIIRSQNRTRRVVSISEA